MTDVVDPGAIVHTDGWPSYAGSTLGFEHHVTVISASPSPAHVLMPAVHRVASLLKRWLLGTLQGAVSVEHLPYYLDDSLFVSTVERRALVACCFYRLVEQAVQIDHVTTKALSKNTGAWSPPSPRWREVDTPSEKYLRGALMQALGEDKAGAIIDRIMVGSSAFGLESLKWMEPRAIAEMIRFEHPQIIALILAYLEGDSSAAILQELSPKVRVDVMMRVATLDGFSRPRWRS